VPLNRRRKKFLPRRPLQPRQHRRRLTPHRPRRRLRLYCLATRLRPQLTPCRRLRPLTRLTIIHRITIWLLIIITTGVRTGLRPHRGVGGNPVGSGEAVAFSRLAGRLYSADLAISIVSIMAVASTTTATSAIAPASATGTTRPAGTMTRTALPVSSAHPRGPTPR
jgi:hypothetical protein